jgi:hypothetical protein
VIMLKEPSNPSPGKGIGSSLPSSVSGGSGISSAGGLSEPSLPILLIRCSNIDCIVIN